MSQPHPTQNDHIMFITTNTKDRTPLFSNPAYAREAVEVLYRTQEQYAFLLFGFVIMPDHCHVLLKICPPNTISDTIRAYKIGVSFSIEKGVIWQPRFHLVIPKEPWKVLEYIHLNPVRAKLTEKCEDYFWSSGSGKWDISQMDNPLLRG